MVTTSWAGTGGSLGRCGRRTPGAPRKEPLASSASKASALREALPGTRIMRVPMPIYEYRCEKGHTFEVMQKMTDDPVTTCEVHGTPVQRVFHPVAVHFKGSGFYNTDYGT